MIWCCNVFRKLSTGLSSLVLEIPTEVFDCCCWCTLQWIYHLDTTRQEVKPSPAGVEVQSFRSWNGGGVSIYGNLVSRNSSLCTHERRLTSFRWWAGWLIWTYLAYLTKYTSTVLSAPPGPWLDSFRLRFINRSTTNVTHVMLTSLRACGLHIRQTVTYLY